MGRSHGQLRSDEIECLSYDGMLSFDQVAEGFTLVEHMGRTYPQLFVYKCDHCNGAGTITCPHCKGFKVKKATSHNGFRLSDQTDIGRCALS
jgi:hypothetical protein